MPFRDDERAVTVQIGAVLLFGILIVSMSLYQATAVPAENREVEFDHSQRVQEDMLEVRNAVLRSASSGTTQPASVSLGTRYPNRLLFVNPPPATGRISTTGAATDGVVVENARALDPETRDYWTGAPRSYETTGLGYRPGYNEYDGAPVTAYEHSVLYDRFGEGTTIARTDQRLVEGRRISLVTLDGALSDARAGATEIDFRPASPAARTVAVTDDGDPVTITVATRLPEDAWRELLDPELETEGGYVRGIDYAAGSPYNRLTLTLVPNETYRLRLARVGVGRGVAPAEPRYLALVDRQDGPVAPGSTHRVTVEARDRFNNPVSGVRVTADATAGDYANASAVTGADGRATFEYTAPRAGARRR
ncbi:Ig-like domain-containing protein [Halegenticoccus soli]|uniref:Ig-like domain-containing protein n=1 Tax=Halegenticoccus soli TaxID=1985678 RepID=UPI000C6E75D7|nr:Ig-like domain-containing protein [Halegenticoccus soli]